MSYTARHNIRQQVIRLVLEINPKTKIDKKDFNVFALFKGKDALAILKTAKKVIKKLLKIKAVKPSAIDPRDEHSFQFKAPGVTITVTVTSNAVSLLMLAAPEENQK